LDIFQVDRELSLSTGFSQYKVVSNKPPLFNYLKSK
jgi:hypothetical protein